MYVGTYIPSTYNTRWGHTSRARATLHTLHPYITQRDCWKICFSAGSATLHPTLHWVGLIAGGGVVYGVRAHNGHDEPLGASGQPLPEDFACIFFWSRLEGVARPEIMRMLSPMTTIRELRRSKGLSQSDLATLLGVALSTVYRWEKGLMPVSGTKRARLLELLGEEPLEVARGRR